MSHRLLATIEVEPGHLAINQAHRPAARIEDGKAIPYRRPSTEYKRAYKEAVRQLKLVEADTVTGPVRLVVAVHWPRRYADKSPEHMRGLALGDVDAPVKAVCDAIAEAGLIENDGQIVELHVRKFPLAEGARSRLIVWISTLAEDTHAASVG